jgi:glycosyltransferase involved in cell wall biosynthesis
MKQPKKKVIFSSYDDIHNPYYGGGGAHAISAIAKRLAPFFDITIITANYPGGKNMREDGVHYKRIGPSSIDPRTGQLVFSSLLPWYATHEEYDIWFESFTPPFSTSFVPLFTKKPVVGLVHMLASEDMERKYKLPFHLVENQGLKTYKNFLVLSEIFKKRIEKINKDAKFFVIPNGVENIIYKKGEKKEEYILFIGRLEFDQKGLDLLLDAYRSICNKTQIKLVIAGSGLEKDIIQLKKVIKDYQLEDRVELVGRVTGETKDLLFKNASFVATSSRYETFSLVTLEAMAYGKPVVTFAIDALQWFPKNCVLQVPPFDVEQFGQAMYRLATEKKLRKQLIANSKKILPNYSWRKIFWQYKEVIDQLTS